MAPPDRGDEPSPMELSDATQDTTQTSPMNMSHETDEIVDIPALDDGQTAILISAYQPATIEDDNVLEPEVVVPRTEGVPQRSDSTIHAGFDYYKNIPMGGHSRLHIGNNYYVANNVQTLSSRNYRDDRGFGFEMETSYGNEQQLSAFQSAYESREVYMSKKRPVLPLLLSHQEAYKTYTPVTNVEVRSCLEQIARLFTDLDEFFAGMFVHVMLSSATSKLSRELAQIRREISSRQATDSSQGDCQGGIYLGDLGHYCEALLERKKKEHKPGATTSLPEFSPTHIDEQSWIDYLEDGLEIPDWKLMLNAFSSSRLRRSTLGGKVIATALISMRSDIVDLRGTLQRVLDRVPKHEDIEGILSVVDKRIKILQGFTDRVALDKRSRERRFKTDVNTDDNTGAKPVSSTSPQSPPSDPLLLVTLVLLTLIAAVVPFTLGFKASNETGTTSDADFSYNISSSIFTIMANFVMIIQLTQGSRLSKQYMYVWIWFILGIVCAIISVAIYPLCNTAWSSIMSFFAAIAGFGATLSVAMTVANPRSDEPLAKNKVE